MSNRFTFFVFCTLILLSGYARAHEEGRYPVINYHHKEYSGASQNWAVTQDKRGIMYFANNVGVIEFDGNEWRLIPINGQIARCLDVDSEGRVWIGGQDEFGYLAADSTNSLVYFSLVNLISEIYQPLGMVRQVYCHSNGTYFSSNNLLIRVNDDLTVNVWKPKTVFHRAFCVNGVIFVSQNNYGLTYLQNDTLKRALKCDSFGGNPIYEVLPYDENSVLIATQSEGFYLYRLDQIKNPKAVADPSSLLTKFPTTNDSYFRDKWVYSGVRVGKEQYAIGTYRGGVVFMDKQGRIERILNSESGLQDDAVWHLFVDANRVLWMALNNGISNTMIKSQVSSWGVEYGVQGTMQSVTRFKNDIYVSTNVGVFKKKGNRFEQINGIADLCWGLHVVNGANYSKMLIAGSQRIYEFDGVRASAIENGGNFAYTFLESKFYPNIIYVGLYSGLGVIYNNNGNFRFIGTLKGTTGEVVSVVEDGTGDLWYSCLYRGIGYVDVVNPYQMVAEDPILYKLPHNPKGQDIVVAKKGTSIITSSERGLSRYSSVDKAFVPDAMLGAEFANGTASLRLLNVGASDTIWYETYVHSESRNIVRAILQPDGSYLKQQGAFRQIPATYFNQISIENDGVLWLATTDGLYRYDSKVEDAPCGSLNALIRKVIVNSKDVVYNGVFHRGDPKVGNRSSDADKDNEQIFSHSQNSLVFHFSALGLNPYQKVFYRYKLQGYDSEWSATTEEKKKEYTNLPFGSYSFLVQALDDNGQEGPIASYNFYINVPWFLEWYSYLLYAAVLGLVVWLAVTFNNRRFVIQNEKLQLMVDERMEELVKSEHMLKEQNVELENQKEEIQSQRDALEVRNRRINDSIQYAKTIQQAILPNLDQVFEGLFQHFLLYYPKDLVSGDFYWVAPIGTRGKQPDKMLVAVVDCTGHGVPGAFMSLIGSRLLSEIVVERKIYSPAAILGELASSVRRALHQEDGEGLDGMDVAICMIERKAEDHFVVTFAGANRPLYYYQKDDMAFQSIHGSRKSIGTLIPDVDSEFKNWRLSLHRGDMLFMCTDGIVDQNNINKRKFKAVGLQDALLNSISKPMDEMLADLIREFDDFRRGEPQRDDITVLGIRL